MALGKPSKKTQKTASEAPAKSKSAIAGTKTKTPEARAEKPAQNSSEAASVATRSAGSPKTMAAVAGQSSSQQSGSQHAASEVPFAVDLTAHPKGANGINPEAIAQRAYHYWAERGFAHGYAEEDWARAEADLKDK